MYRGTNYKYPYFHYSERVDSFLDKESSEFSSSGDEDEEDDTSSQRDSSHEESSDNPVVACTEQINARQGKSQTIGCLTQSLSRERYNSPDIIYQTACF